MILGEVFFTTKKILQGRKEKKRAEFDHNNKILLSSSVRSGGWRSGALDQWL